MVAHSIVERGKDTPLLLEWWPPLPLVRGGPDLAGKQVGQLSSLSLIRSLVK